jgi:hypothetical protein
MGHPKVLAAARKPRKLGGYETVISGVMLPGWLAAAADEGTLFAWVTEASEAGMVGEAR